MMILSYDGGVLFVMMKISDEVMVVMIIVTQIVVVVMMILSYVDGCLTR